MGDLWGPDMVSDLLARTYIHEPRRIRVITIGAGISGIAFAYKAAKFENVEYQIYEKNEDVGGTWFESRYPGCACDVPAHVYTYSWVGNPDWSGVFCGAGEIWQFYQKLAKEYGVYEKTKFKHEVIKAIWNDETALWEVTVRDLATGSTFIDRAEVLINSGGVLNNWKWPSIDGLHDFAGTLVHSAHWDQTLELSDKRVAVIGSGSSALQIVPTIQPTVKKLISFNRSPTWLTAEFGGQFAKDGRNTKYTPEEIKKFNEDKHHFLEYRQAMAHTICSRFPTFYKNSKAQKTAFDTFTKTMADRLKHDPILVRTLIPKFPVGCRRATPGHGYLEALIAPNTAVVTEGIEKITNNGIISKDGVLHEVDVIITATGYDTSFVPRFPIIGLDGVNLQQVWAQNGAQAYLSVAVPGFPNYFLTTGPNAPITNGSLIGAIERQLDYALTFVQKIQTQELHSVVVTPEAADDFQAWKDEFMKGMSWSGDCTSWYKNGTRDRKVTGPWPGSVHHFFETLKQPRYEDFVIKSKSKNRFRYLGDGRSPLEAKGLPLGGFMQV